MNPTIGIDSGGTFTDGVAIGADGIVLDAKVPSTPDDPSRAVGLCADLLSSVGASRMVHGTTVATNAILENKLARVALITTAGFRDVIAIGRQNRRELYSLEPENRSCPVPDELRFEVSERIDSNGNVLRALSPEDARQTIQAAISAGAESLAVCLLFSYLRPEHEQLIAEIAREFGIPVSLSSHVAPVYREYERSITTCINSAVRPVMERYLSQLQTGYCKPKGIGLRVTQSDGGHLSSREAGELAVKTVLSGPAAGVTAADALARATGIRRHITFDMGGTSTDVSLINGAVRTLRQGSIGGLPILTPMRDIHTVGAGGGSIAWVDPAGVLRVGPQSAGANPGPAAYGVGTEATVTDAHLVLGRVLPETRLAGRVALGLDAARRAVSRIGQRIGLTTEETAEGILSITSAKMGRAIRHISTTRGFDPSEFTLLSFGGAGGLHVCELAEELHMRSAIIPRWSGAFSALGAALAPAMMERSITRVLPLDQLAQLDSSYLELQDFCRTSLQVGERNRTEYTKTLEVRYRGQTYTLPVSWSPNPDQVRRKFETAYKRMYGHIHSDKSVEIAGIGVTATSGVARSYPLACERFETETGHTEVTYHGRKCAAARMTNAHGWGSEVIVGPAVLCEANSTVWVPPGWSAKPDDWGSLRLERD